VSRFLFLLLLLGGTLFGRYWDYEYEITLEKDEVAEYLITDRVREKTFTFRWTLYINNGLILVVNLDGYPYQKILYKDYNRNSFQMKLHGKRALLMVEFSEFDVENKKASFLVLVKNSSVEPVLENELL
jgi:hypothetical protein